FNGLSISASRFSGHTESQRGVRRAVERDERNHGGRSQSAAPAAPATAATAATAARYMAQSACWLSGAERSAVGLADGQRLELAAARELTEPEHCGRCVGSVLTAQ